MCVCVCVCVYVCIYTVLYIYMSSTRLKYSQKKRLEGITPAALSGRTFLHLYIFLYFTEFL